MPEWQVKDCRNNENFEVNDKIVVRQLSCINLSFYFKGFGNQKRLDAHMTNGDCPGKPNPKWHYTNMTAKRLFCIHPECLGPNGFDINYLENSFNSGKIGGFNFSCRFLNPKFSAI